MSGSRTRSTIGLGQLTFDQTIRKLLESAVKKEDSIRGSCSQRYCRMDSKSYTIRLELQNGTSPYGFKGRREEIPKERMEGDGS